MPSSKKAKKINNPRSSLPLAVLSGLLLALAFPRAGLGWVAWVAWVPLLIAIARTSRRRMAFVIGWLTGVVWFFPLLRWMPEVMGNYGGMSPLPAWAAYALLIVVLACYPALACFWTRHLLQRYGCRSLPLFPFIWVTLEFLQSVTPLGGLPWLLAGYTQTRFLTVIQLADLTGVYGVSWLVLAVNTALALLALRLSPLSPEPAAPSVPDRQSEPAEKQNAAAAPKITPTKTMTAARFRSRQIWLPPAGAALLVAGALLYGHLALRHWEKVAVSYNAALLQGNISVNDPAQTQEEKFESGYVRMADSLAPGTVDLVVLPESPAPKLWQFDADYRRVMRALARRYPLGLIISNIRDAENSDRAYYNSAFFLNSAGELTGVYDKTHLVPFGEYVPYKKLLFFAETVSREMGGFSAGQEVRVLPLDGHPTGAVICFEAVFPDLVRRFVAAGGQLLVNLTNDGWYGISAAPYQHLEIARLRAVENRRWLLRAANTGFSAIIAPTGRIEAITGLETTAICQGKFAFIADKTFYTRSGNLFLWLCAIISIGAGLPAWRRETERRKKITRRN